MKELYEDFYSKLTPMAPVKRDGMNQLICSHCEECINGGKADNNFCRKCGLRLDWSEVDDSISKAVERTPRQRAIDFLS